MKPLYLDIGNTFLKMARRENSGWQTVFEGELERLDELRDAIETVSKSKKIFVSSVRKDITKWLNKSFPNLLIREYKTSDIPAKKLSYDTPETLGLDRFLVCLGAFKQSKTKNVIVIDAGSACTVDLMTEDGVYRGGVIMPGLKLIQHAMEKRLPELPIVPGIVPKTWPGKSTVECIEWGVNGGFMMAIRGFINQYRSMIDDPDMYVTGGDAESLVKWMGDEEELIHSRHLIWEGMEEFGELLNTTDSLY